MTKRKIALAIVATVAMPWTIAHAQTSVEGTSDCLFTGYVVGLDPHGDNFLSVRRRPNGPSGGAFEVDQLFTSDEVCVSQASGRWLFVKYQRSGRMFSGWVFDRYIRQE
jgi:hypothetical protein